MKPHRPVEVALTKESSTMALRRRSLSRWWSLLAALAIVAAVIGTIAATSGGTGSARVSAAAADQPEPPPPPDLKAMADSATLPVADSQGKVRGTVPSAAVFGNDRELVTPVTASDGSTAGYFLQEVGFVERDVVDVPGFDAATYIATWRADQEAKVPAALRAELGLDKTR